MKARARLWRKFLKRHAEAFFIVAFLLADCFLSGWALTAGTVAAILYVFLPSVWALKKLTPAARITYVKALIKTPKVQRLAVLLFWIYSIRFVLDVAINSRLFTLVDPRTGGGPSLTSALIHVAGQWAPLAYLVTPLIIYAGACMVAIFLRSRLKASRQDPDLIKQKQLWSGVTSVLFMSAFIGGILSITLNTHGPAFMLSNWLLASGEDANITLSRAEIGSWSGEVADNGVSANQGDSKTADVAAPKIDGALPPSAGGTYAKFTEQPLLVGSPALPMLQGVEPYEPTKKYIGIFDAFILSSCSIALFMLLLEPVLRLNFFLTSFCWRVISPKSLQNMIEGFLEALHLPSRTLGFNEANPLLRNGLRTLAWLVICYAALFWLFGFCGGPLGHAIQNWMIASVADAGFSLGRDSISSGIVNAPAWLFEPRIRIFLGSIVALYGTAPIAISAAVFLPYARSRKIILNCDGMLFTRGPFLPLWGRQSRLWSDLKSMSLEHFNATESRPKAKFKMTFRSGGHVTFSNYQISASDLKVLMESIDQHAVACSVSPEVFSACRNLEAAGTQSAATDGLTDATIDSISAQDFKSTIFLPFSAGELLPDTQIRIIRQLASKPLCAVYLGRNDDGRLVTVKQFYLPDESDETKALHKIMTREYELLTRLDHPGISKILNFFSHEESTYLIIEHRVGTDLRRTVEKHGPRSEGLTIAWARQLCDIMIYLHAREPVIVHRDLTPDNVIAGDDGQLRLIDFGAAREFLDGITGTMIGKHCYVAPEQLRGQANQRSDIYSFGCTLYFLLTGRDPLALSQSSPAKNIDCSEGLDRLVRDCTEFEEEKRPQSFQEVLSRLNELDRGVRINIASKEEAPV